MLNLGFVTALTFHQFHISKWQMCVCPKVLEGNSQAKTISDFLRFFICSFYKQQTGYISMIFRKQHHFMVNQPATKQ